MPAVPDLFRLPEGARRVPLAVLANDGETAVVIAATNTLNGRLEVYDSQLFYTPDPDFVGFDDFIYTTRDGTGAASATTVTIEVTRSNDQVQSLVDPRILPELSPSGRVLEIAEVARLPVGDNPGPARPNAALSFDGAFFVLDQGDAIDGAMIYRLVDSPGGAPTPEPFFDIEAAVVAAGRTINYGTGLTQGVRSFAFHPDFATNGLIYVSMVQRRPLDISGLTYLYDPPDPIGLDSVVAEWRFDPATLTVDAESYREVFRIGTPLATHLVQQVGFDPHAAPGDSDYGLLYVAHGDASAQPAIQGGGLRNDAYGKILRVDPRADGARGYTVPASNPFVGDDAMLDEVWSLGHRNPQSFTFVRDGEGRTRMILTEIGRDNFEEINLIEPGGNYGWSEREGPLVHLNLLEGAGAGVAPLPGDEAQGGRTYPAAFIGHDDAFGQNDLRIAIAGGGVLANGSALDGQYVFGDFAGRGRLYHVPLAALTQAATRLDPDDPARDAPADLTWATPSEFTLLHDADGDPATAPVVVSSFLDIVGGVRSDLRFGTGPDGALYATSKTNGAVYRLRETTPIAPDATAVVLTVKGFGTPGDPPSFSVFADGHFLGEAALSSLLQDGSGPTETFIFRLRSGTAPTRVEVIYDPPAAAGAALEVLAVAFGGESFDGTEGRFAPVDRADAAGAVERIVDAGALVFTAPGAAAPADFRVEAEALLSVASYQRLALAAASGGFAMQSTSTTPGVIRHHFSGPTGVYDLGIGHFDENDAVASMKVLLNGREIDAWSWDADLGSPLAVAETLTERRIGEIALRAGDVVELLGQRARNEPVRLDYLDFDFLDEVWAFDRPVASGIRAPAVAPDGASTIMATVRYDDKDGVDPASVDPSDLVVTGPGGVVLRVLSAVATPAVGGGLVAAYEIGAPGGSWGLDDAGTYTVALADGAVSDMRGARSEGQPALLTFEGPAWRRIEAESLALATNFAVERIGGSAASADTVIRAVSAVESVARLTFAGDPGLYRLRYGFFDESDGAAALSVLVGGVVVDSTVWNDNTTGSANANLSTARLREVGVVELDTMDSIEFRGSRDGQEPLRLDYLELLTIDFNLF